MKKNQKVNIDDMKGLYNFISENLQCSRSECDFDLFIDEIGKRIMKEEVKNDPAWRDSDALFQMYAGFSVGFVLGNLTEITYAPKEIQTAIEKIKGELIRVGAVPGLVKKAG